VLPPPGSDSSGPISQEAASRFALADLDGDGQLSKQEFESESQFFLVSFENSSILLPGLVIDQANLEDVPPSALALKRLFFVSMVLHHSIIVLVVLW
jgi:hypothetical protein